MKNILYFTKHQALSCLFPVVIFASIALTKFVEIPFIPRYDLILMICIVTQIIMLKTGMETRDEFKASCLFHVIGLAMEIFKVNMGSWVYPEFAHSKVFGAPLYGGFMYASVASYVCQAWRRFDLKFVNWPNKYVTISVATAIYLNFFTLHFAPDVRLLIATVAIVIFAKSFVQFNMRGKRWKMPVLGSFALIGLFIWTAENYLTFFNAWRYPNQADIWRMVNYGKIGSWILLVTITIIIVVNLKHKKAGATRKVSPAKMARFAVGDFGRQFD